MGGTSVVATVPGTAYLLDTGILIRSLRGEASINARMASESLLYTSSVVLGELYYGAYGASRESEDLLAIDDLSQRLTILELTPETARHYGRIKREQRLKGQMLPENDIWIAATTFQYGITLAGNDIHFTWINGLKYEQW